MAKSSTTGTLASVGVRRGPREQGLSPITKEDSVAISARLPRPLFVRLKARMAEEGCSIQDFVHRSVASYVAGDRS